MKKCKLQSYDMKGNNLIRLWYTVPLLLSANAPKQNKSIDSSSSSPISLGPVVMPYAGPGYKVPLGREVKQGAVVEQLTVVVWKI
jgi:hypothetical protein